MSARRLLDPWCGVRELVRLRFARAGRARRLHLSRFLGVAFIAFIVGLTVWEQARRPVVQLWDNSGLIGALGGLLVLWAAVGSLAAAGELAGPEARRRLGLLMLTELRPAALLGALWASLLLRILAELLLLAPVLAALTLIGGMDVEQLGLVALSVLHCAMVIGALGYLLGTGAGSPASAVLRVGGALFGLGAMLALLAATTDSTRVFDLLEHTVSYLPFAPMMRRWGGPMSTAPWWGSSAATLGLSGLLLGGAWLRLRARFRPGTRRVRAAVPAAGAAAGTGSERQRRSREVVGPPLRWLALHGPIGKWRRGLLSVAILLALGLLARLIDKGWAGVFDAEYLAQNTGLLLSGAAVLAMVAAGQFWLRLRSGGLLPVLLSTPATSAELVGAALRAALLQSAPLFLAAAAGLGLMTVLAGGTLPAFLAGQLAIAGALALLAATTCLDAADLSATRGALQLRVPGVALLLFGTSFVWITSALLSRRVWSVDLGNAFLVLGYIVAPIGGALLIAIRRDRWPRLFLYLPLLLLSIPLPALLCQDKSQQEIGWLVNPVGVLVSGFLLGGGVQVSDGEIWRIALFGGVALLGVAGLLAYLMGRRLDPVLGRAR